MPSLRVAPENKDTVPKRKKLVRRRSTKRWWLKDEAKQGMKNEFDLLVQLTERAHFYFLFKKIREQHLDQPRSCTISDFEFH